MTTTEKESSNQPAPPPTPGSDESSSPVNNNTHVYTNLDLKPRFQGPELENMSGEQRGIRDTILANRPRTGLTGPFGAWISVPQIARPAEQLGRACRYGTSLSQRETELVILLTGSKARCHTEFDVHVGEGLKAGLTMDIIAAIPRDEAFSVQAVHRQVIPLLANEREQAIAMYTAELVDTFTISDETYSRTKAAVGEQNSVLVEITSIAGYYVLGAFVLNAFRIPSKK
jgi:4-carboxymuconolactone decarboxylase